MSPGPLGAQYWPVMLMSNFSTKETRDFAAVSGVTAVMKTSSEVSSKTHLRRLVFLLSKAEGAKGIKTT
jgi:hypothetical protein